MLVKDLAAFLSRLDPNMPLGQYGNGSGRSRSGVTESFGYFKVVNCISDYNIGYSEMGEHQPIDIDHDNDAGMPIHDILVYVG